MRKVGKMIVKQENSRGKMTTSKKVQVVRTDDEVKNNEMQLTDYY